MNDGYLVELWVLPEQAASPRTRQGSPYGVHLLASRWSDRRTQGAVRRFATCATLLSARLARWYNASDFFTNRDNLEVFARASNIWKEELIMARNSKKTNDFQRDTWKGFVERRLTDQELFEATEWQFSDADMVECIVALTEVGYKFTASFNGATKAATATLHAGEPQGKSAGWALSAKGENARDALKLLMYKHYHILHEDWSELLGEKPFVQRG